MQYDIRLQDTGPVTAIARRATVDRSLLGGVIHETLDEAYRYLAAVGGVPNDAPFVIYREMTDDGRRWNVDIAAPIEHAVEPPHGYRLLVVPRQTVARTVHRGPYQQLGEAYDAVGAWVGARDLALTGPPRESYLSEPTVPGSETVTLIEWPVEQLASLVGDAAGVPG